MILSPLWHVFTHVKGAERIDVLSCWRNRKYADIAAPFQCRWHRGKVFCFVCSRSACRSLSLTSLHLWINTATTNYIRLHEHFFSQSISTLWPKSSYHVLHSASLHGTNCSMNPCVAFVSVRRSCRHLLGLPLEKIHLFINRLAGYQWTVCQCLSNESCHVSITLPVQPSEVRTRLSWGDISNRYKQI